MSAGEREHYGLPPWDDLLSHDIKMNQSSVSNCCFRCGRTVRDIMANGGACLPPAGEIRDIQPGDGYGHP